MVLNPRGLIPLGALVLGGWLSFGAFGLVPRDGFHPLSLMASLLPLQLAALLWAFRGAGSRGSGSPPPASD